MSDSSIQLFCTINMLCVGVVSVRGWSVWGCVVYVYLQSGRVSEH